MSVFLELLRLPRRRSETWPFYEQDVQQVGDAGHQGARRGEQEARLCWLGRDNVRGRGLCASSSHPMMTQDVFTQATQGSNCAVLR